MSTILNSENISKITEKEKELTGEARPVKGGPTAQAQQLKPKNMLGNH